MFIHTGFPKPSIVCLYLGVLVLSFMSMQSRISKEEKKHIQHRSAEENTKPQNPNERETHIHTQRENPTFACWRDAAVWGLRPGVAVGKEEAISAVKVPMRAPMAPPCTALPAVTSATSTGADCFFIHDFTCTSSSRILDCTNWSGFPPSILVEMVPLLACILFSKAWRRGKPQSDGDGERQKKGKWNEKGIAH